MVFQFLMCLGAPCNLVLGLLFFLLPKVSTNHLWFRSVKYFPIAQPTANPLIQPKALMTQSITSESSSSLVVTMGGVDGDSCIFSHLLDNRLPHNPGFPLKELLSKVSNWLPCGMGPTRRLWDTLKTSRNVNLVSSWGIPPESLFIDLSLIHIWRCRRRG